MTWSKLPFPCGLGDTVMYLFGAVETDPHHEVMLLEELAPLGCQQRSVGLEGICDGLRPDERLLQLNYSLKKIQTQ